MRTIIIAVLFLMLAAPGPALAETSGRPVCGSLQDCDALIRTTPGIEAYERRGYLHLMQRRGLDLAFDEVAQRIAKLELLRGEIKVVHISGASE